MRIHQLHSKIKIKVEKKILKKWRSLLKLQNETFEERFRKGEVFSKKRIYILSVDWSCSAACSNSAANIWECQIFNNDSYGVGLRSGWNWLNVYNCDIYNNLGGGAIVNGAVEDCRIWGNAQNGLVLRRDVSVQNNQIFNNGGIGLYIEEVPTFDEVIKNNSIFGNGAYDLAVAHNCFAPRIDATFNWWGTTNIEEIEENIYDINDNPGLNTEVIFIPFLEGPVGVDNENPVVHRTGLNPPCPNPFNPQTTISFELSQSSHVRLSIYDLLGRQVAVLFDGYRHAGPGSVTWNGQDGGGAAVSSGVYIARLESATGVWTEKLVVAR